MSIRSLLVAAVAAASLVSGLLGCGRAPANEAERIGEIYAGASAEYEVPRPLLEAIGYLETRWVMRPGEATIDQGYGVMHLTDWAGRSQLQQAARLTGYPVEQLKTDAEANIRAAAALLRAEADRYFAETPSKDPADLAAWWQIVMRYSGYDDAEAADQFATDVFQLVTRGARAALKDASVYEMSPHLIEVGHEKLFGEVQQAVSPDYASAIWRPANSGNYSTGRDLAISMVVIHTAQGSYSSVYNWFANPSASASAHYVVKSSNGEISSMVHDRDTAWHAGNWDYNSKSIGIEHEGYVDQPSYLTEAMYQASANLTRWLCDTYRIPKDRQHIIGHNEVPNPNRPGSFGGAGSHHDPCVTLDGSQCFWNWQHYMQLVGGQSTQTGLLTGTIFSSEGGCKFCDTVNAGAGCPAKGFQNCTAVVAGARVFVPETGATVLSGADGKFRLNLPPATYSPNASAAGFHDAGPVLGAREVTAGATTFSSVILQKIQSTGTLKGIVYRIDPANGGDHSQRIEGAVVSVTDGGATAVVSTNANGEFQLTLPSGNRSVTATKDGYVATTQTVSVPGGGQASVELGLKASGDQQPPRVAFTRPAEGSTVSENPTRVEGTVSEPVQSLKLGSLSVSVGADLKWVANVPLVPGANTIEAVAVDQAGNEGRASLHLTFVAPKEGVQGKVFDVVTQQPVKDAVVSVGEVFSKTGEDGLYRLDIAAGAQALSVQAIGYVARSVSLTVPTGARTTQDIALVPSAEAATLLVITSPAEGATVATEQVEVKGTAKVALSSLRVNDQAAEVLDGAFATTVTLEEGENTLVAKGRTQDGLEVSTQVKVTYTPAAPESGCGCQSGGLDLSLLALGGLLVLARRRTVRA